MLAAPPPAPAPPARRRHRWLVAAAAGWAVVLVVLAVVSARRDAPTVREQRTIAQAAPLVDAAAGELVAAAGADAVVQVGAARVTGGCRITPMRDGAVLEREVVVYARAGDAPALLDRIATRLPAAYAAGVSHGRGGTVHRLVADAGEFVGVDGRAGAGGVLTFTVETGCRPVDGDPAARPLPGVPVAPEQARVLAALGLRADPAAGGPVAGREVVPCPGGGQAQTLVVTAGPRPADLAGALAPVTRDATVLLAEPDRQAYRAGATGVVVEADADRLTISATTTCR